MTAAMLILPAAIVRSATQSRSPRCHCQQSIALPEWLNRADNEKAIVIPLNVMTQPAAYRFRALPGTACEPVQPSAAQR
jgi:hypothetical protein